MNPPDQPLEDLDPDVAAATEARLEAYAVACAGTPEGEQMDREWHEHESEIAARDSTAPYPPPDAETLHTLARLARDASDAVLSLHEAWRHFDGKPIDAEFIATANGGAKQSVGLLSVATDRADPAGWYLEALPKMERDVLAERLQTWARAVDEMADGEKAWAE